MQQVWVHYLMSWGGMLYDLSIPFLLLFKKTRKFGFFMVVFFHAFTRVLFPIGVFPIVMIISSLIFFDEKFHTRIINFIKNLLLKFFQFKKREKFDVAPKSISRITAVIIFTFFIIQLIMPLRHMMYPGNIMWHEQGYRFSWRVMLMEKIGYSTFKIEQENGTYFYVKNEDHLTSYQEKQMSFQPDFILEYAHYLAEHFEKQGHTNVQVFADSFVALNGRPSQRFIAPDIDLYKEVESFKHKKWVIPFTDEIYGL